MRVRVSDLTGASSCSFHSFIFCHAWSWASICSYMYIKSERKGVWIIFLFCSLTFCFVYCFCVTSCPTFNRKGNWNTMKHLTVQPKKLRMLINTHLKKQSSKHPFGYPLFWFLFSPPLYCPVHVFQSHYCMCIVGGVICTTEGGTSEL